MTIITMGYDIHMSMSIHSHQSNSDTCMQSFRIANLFKINANDFFVN